jgi:hypothetical protein
MNLEQQMTNVTVDTAVTVSDEGHVEYGLQTNSGDCEVVGFMCGNGHFLEHEGCRVVDEDDVIAWLKAHPIKLPVDELEDVVSHDQLVHRIADSYQALHGEELAGLWNELFPTTPVAYEGDSIYRWVKT